MAGAETVCPAEEKGARRAPAGSADAPPSAPRKRQKAPLAFRSGAEREGQPKEIGLLRYIIEWCIGFRVQDLGFPVQGLGFRIQNSGLRVRGPGFQVQGSLFKVLDSRFRAQVLGFQVQDSRCRVQDSG